MKIVYEITDKNLYGKDTPWQWGIVGELITVDELAGIVEKARQNNDA